MNITTPVGRLLMGSLYKAQTTDAEGKPLVIKSGPNTGQPKVQFFFAVGIPKGAEQHWAQTPWGALIYKEGTSAFPGPSQAPSFAWKIVDGDSAIPNRAGKAPNTREGYPGNWVLSFTSGFAPKIYNKDGSQMIVEPDAVKLGYYVQVNGTVAGNGSTQQPGLFLNHNMVALAGYGPEIIVGPDASSVGFGQGPLPAGMMAAPAGGFNPAPVAAMPAAPAAYAPVAAMPTPNPAFLGMPTPPAPPMPTPPPPVPQAKVLTAKAGGATYEQMIQAGWTEAQLVQHGYL